MNFNAPILVIVPPRTAAGSRSGPRLGLGVIYGDFGEAALVMHRTSQQVRCWLIGHDAGFLCLSELAGTDFSEPEIDRSVMAITAAEAIVRHTAPHQTA
jgi:hypothetical protein